MITFSQFVTSGLDVVVMLVLMAVAVVLLLSLFFNGWRKSGKHFWEFMADVDDSYPSQPNTRLMYRKLSLVTDNHSAMNEVFQQLREDTNVIRDHLEQRSQARKDQDLTDILARAQRVLEYVEIGQKIARSPETPARNIVNFRQR